MRRLLPALLLLTPALLAACATPQERCINRNTRELRTMQNLIAETKANIDRGYALEEYTIWVPSWEICEIPVRTDPDKPPPPPRYCLDEEAEVRTRPKAIDLRAEQAKLDSLIERRKELMKAARPVIAECVRQYPE